MKGFQAVAADRGVASKNRKVLHPFWPQPSDGPDIVRVTHDDLGSTEDVLVLDD